jgi:CheY-like chemotaxis protein
VSVKGQRLRDAPTIRRRRVLSSRARAERLPQRRGRGDAPKEGGARKRRLEALSGAGRSRPSASPSVLVVDDEASIRLICRTNLRAHGLSVLEAADGEEALTIARREQPDLILLDVMLPGLDGLEVARRLAADERTAAIPVAFLSARAEEADLRRGLELGAVAYFTKPFDPIGLSAEVESLLKRLREQGLERVREEERARLGGDRRPDG